MTKVNKGIILMVDAKLASFKDFIWQFYANNKREFAWRNVDDPYLVVVSEIMLQQTQTYRVAPKFEAFIAAFPSFEELAQAPLRDVLIMWQGLGYNRRGKYLHEIAQKVMREYGGQLPNNSHILKTFPGIGPNTAGSICAFAFNEPVVFIETNIRAVFLHHFFKNCSDVHDKELMPLIAATLDQKNPREWYYALMDYGVMLKKNHKNPSRQSKHHAVQSKFEGSDRQIRGTIIKLLARHAQLKQDDFLAAIQKEPARIEKALAQLVQENMITITSDIYQIA